MLIARIRFTVVPHKVPTNNYSLTLIINRTQWWVGVYVFLVFSVAAINNAPTR